MSVKSFTWLAASGSSRELTHDGVKYPAVYLEHGKSYDASRFPAHVVEEWVKTGAAEFKAEKTKGKED